MKRDTALSINPFPCSARKVLLGRTAARRSRPARARNAPPCTGATIWADCKALFQVPEALAVLFMLVGPLYIYATATLAAVLFFLLPSLLPPPPPLSFHKRCKAKSGDPALSEPHHHPSGNNKEETFNGGPAGDPWEGGGVRGSDGGVNK